MSTYCFFLLIFLVANKIQLRVAWVEPQKSHMLLGLRDDWNINSNNMKAFFFPSLFSTSMYVVFINSDSLPFHTWLHGHMRQADTRHEASQLYF